MSRYNIFCHRSDYIAMPIVVCYIQLYLLLHVCYQVHVGSMFYPWFLLSFVSTGLSHIRNMDNTITLDSASSTTPTAPRSPQPRRPFHFQILGESKPNVVLLSILIGRHMKKSHPTIKMKESLAVGAVLDRFIFVTIKFEIEIN